MPALRAPRNASKEEKTKTFLAKARRIHGHKYDYSRVNIRTVDDPVEVICPKHDSFFPTPYSHTSGQCSGCPTCGQERGSKAIRDRHKATFVRRAQGVHGNAYDYSKTLYTAARSKLEIVCPKHGPFWQTADSHLRGIGCPVCGHAKAGLLRSTAAKEAFIGKARKIHGRKYAYSAVEYERASKKVCIICLKHGPWQQKPNNHLSGYGCPRCKDDTLRAKFIHSKSDFLERARRVHGERYSYPGNYVNSKGPIRIRCKIHGEFEQVVATHLSGKGCPKCGQAKLTQVHLSNHEEFVKKARAVHGDKYRYPDRYKRAIVHINVECPKHGLFPVTPNNLLRGYGCPRCSESHGESAVARALERLKLPYTREKKFPDCRDKYPLRFDFWLPTKNALIEFDGLQHHEPYALFGGLKMFKVTKRRDRIKTAYARKKGIRLLRVKYSVKEIEAFISKRLGA